LISVSGYTIGISEMNEKEGEYLPVDVTSGDSETESAMNNSSDKSQYPNIRSPRSTVDETGPGELDDCLRDGKVEDQTLSELFTVRVYDG
jgi:hypothetical protein